MITFDPVLLFALDGDELVTGIGLSRFAYSYSPECLCLLPVFPESEESSFLKKMGGEVPRRYGISLRLS